MSQVSYKLFFYSFFGDHIHVSPIGISIYVLGYFSFSLQVIKHVLFNSVHQSTQALSITMESSSPEPMVETWSRKHDWQQWYIDSHKLPEFITCVILSVFVFFSLCKSLCLASIGSWYTTFPLICAKNLPRILLIVFISTAGYGLCKGRGWLHFIILMSCLNDNEYIDFLCGTIDSFSLHRNLLYIGNHGQRTSLKDY